MAELDCMEELRLVEEVADIDGGPKYIDHAAQSQGPNFPFPGGYVYFTVMARVPGVNLDDIYQDLSDKQLESIRLQLAHIVDYHMIPITTALSGHGPFCSLVVFFSDHSTHILE